MKKAVFSTLWTILALVATAQVDVSSGNLATESTPFLCRPGVNHKSPGKGVSIDYTFNPNFHMRAPNTENVEEVETNHRIGGKLKIPILNRSNIKFMLGFKYALEKYNFDDIDPENDVLFQHLNNTTLRKSEAAAYLVLPINHKFYSSFRLSAGYQGDYDKFVSLDERFAIYRAVGLLGIKKSDDFEYGIGLLFSKNIRRNSLLPFGFINYTFNEKWGIESAIPANVKLRYNFSDEKIALLGVEYSSQNYSLNLAEPTGTGTNQGNPLANSLYHYRRSSLQLIGSYMHQTSAWTWLEFKAGYAFDLNSEARDLTEMQTYELNPSGSIFGTITFFISPPKKYLHACNSKK